MLTWMLYVLVVTVLLSAAASCAECATRARKGSSRWIWMIGIVASLVVPVLISSISIQIPSVVSSTAIERVIVMSSATSASPSPVSWIAGGSGGLPAWRSLDPLLTYIWLVVSVLLAAGLAASALNLLLRKRTWKTTALNGTDVLVSRDVGPAVIGLLRPQIVIPEWILVAPASHQSVVIAHEQSHLDAGDQQLLAAAVCMLVLMPWNFPLWWQFRRLRRAIEVDCDARVLKKGVDVAAYGEILIQVGRRPSAFVGTVAAMSESASFLEQRIRIMTSMPTKLWRISMVAFAVLSFGLAAFAATIRPPNAGSDPVSHQEAIFPAAALDQFVGFYQFSQNSVLAVTRNADQLTAQVTGRSSSTEIDPTNQVTKFKFRHADATINFIVDGQGTATGFVLHRNSIEDSAVRVDAATAEQANTNVLALVEAQIQMPGSEAVLRKFISGVISGNLDYSDMTPQVAKAVRNHNDEVQPVIQKFGAAQFIEFRGVSNLGLNVYEVWHENGVREWSIDLDANGKISRVAVRDGP